MRLIATKLVILIVVLAASITVPVVWITTLSHNQSRAQAEVVLSAFILEAASPDPNFSMDVLQDRVTYDPNRIDQPFTVCFSDRFMNMQSWEFGVRFQDGSYYYAFVENWPNKGWRVSRFEHRPDLSKVVK